MVVILDREVVSTRALEGGFTQGQVEDFILAREAVYILVQQTRLIAAIFRLGKCSLSI